MTGLQWTKSNGKNSKNEGRGQRPLAEAGRHQPHGARTGGRPRNPKIRPVLVVQNDTSNRYSPVTIVAPVTSRVRLPLSPLHVLLPADSSTGLVVPSVAVFNHIRAVARRRLIKKLGEVDALVLTQVDDAIRAAFGLPFSDDLK